MFDGYFVVAMNLDGAAKLAEVLREVVGKRIVVVEQKNHGRKSSRESSLPLRMGGFQCADKRLRFIDALFEFAGRRRVGDDASARLNMRDAVFDDHRSKRDAGIEIAREVKIENSAGINAAARSFQLFDDF